MCQAAAIKLANLVDDSDLSIVVPGGNTPRTFFEILAEADLDWSHVCLVLSDERMVPEDHKASNYGMIKEILLKKLPDEAQPVVIPNMEEFQKTDNQQFLTKTNVSIRGKMPIRHAFLGIGSDGHTASLFPGDVFDSLNDEPFSFTVRKGDPYQRMTLSLGFLKDIPNIAFLVSGKSKHTPLRNILDSNEMTDKSPAHQLVDESNGQVSILCDQETMANNL